MYCKYCGAQLEDNQTICAACGKETDDLKIESEKKYISRAKSRKLIIWIAVVTVALATLATAWYFLNGGWLPRKNDVMVKDSYTVSDEAIVQKADTVIATIADKQLTNGQLQVYYWMQFFDFLDYYGDYIGTYIALDITKPLDEQYYDESGTTWQQYLLDAALQTWHRYQTLALSAEAKGYQLDAQYSDFLDSQREKLLSPPTVEEENYAKEMLRQQMGVGCSVEDYLHYLEVYCYGVQYFSSVYDQFNPTDAEITAYYNEHIDEFKEMGVLMDDSILVDIRHILVTPEGEEDENGALIYSDAAWEACRIKAQEVLDTWLSGEKTSESFSELAAQKSEDLTSKDMGGLYENVSKLYFGEGTEDLDAWNFDGNRQKGDYTLVRTVYGYHIVLFEGSNIKWKQYAKSSLMTELGNQFTTELMEQYPLEVNYRKIALGLADYSN